MTAHAGATSIEKEQIESQKANSAAPSSIGLKLLLCLGAYFTLHVITRVLLSHNLQLDEAEQLIVTQDWRLGYGSQPPLYNWLQKALFSLFGANVLSLSLLKNAILWSAYAFCFLAAREILKNARLAAVATVALLFFPQIAWESQRDQSHLVLATAFAAATLFIYIRLLKTGRAEWYAWLGAAAALGFLAKYNYLALIAGLGGASLIDPAFRRRALNGRMMIAFLVFLILAGPHLVWMLENKAAVASQSYKFSMPANLGPIPYITGPRQLVQAFLGISALPVLVFLPLLYSVFKTRHRPTLDPLLRLLLWSLVIGLALALVATLAFGVTYIRDRWLQPLFFALPILLVGMVAAQLESRHFRRLFGLAAIVAGCVLLAVNGTALFANTLHRAHNLNVPYAALAADLRKTAFAPGTIIANGFSLGGNLKARFPTCRVIVPEMAETRPPQHPALIVWSARSEDLPEDFLHYAAEIAHVRRATLQAHFIQEPCENGPRKSEKFGFVLLP
jgi:4-amino-4-deoxy-L-arabinose transferase-like glycosyltransferase